MDIRDTILNKAHILYQEKGYSNVTINDICELSNISKPTFYSYFKNKEDTIIHIYDIITAEIVNDVPKLILARNCYEQLLLCFDSLIQQSVAIGYDLISQMFRINLDEDKGSYDFQARFSEVCIAITKRGQEKGEFRNTSNAKELYQVLCYAFTGYEVTWCIKNGQFDFSEQVKKAIQMIYMVDETLL